MEGIFAYKPPSLFCILCCASHRPRRNLTEGRTQNLSYIRFNLERLCGRYVPQIGPTGQGEQGAVWFASLALSGRQTMQSVRGWTSMHHMVCFNIAFLFSLWLDDVRSDRKPTMLTHAHPGAEFDCARLRP
jgi:hypothetical protein